MPHEMLYIFLAAFLLMGMQSIGGYLQIKNYRKTVRRLKPKGKIAVGQKRSGLRNSLAEWKP